MDGEPVTLKHSSYIDDDELIETQNERKSFTILSLNCQSLNAKIDEIKILVETLKYNQSFFCAICLQETWLSDRSDTTLLKLDDYNLISQGKICATHRGFAVYLSGKYNYKLLSLHEYSEIWESKFTEVSGNKSQKKVILGNIYRPSRDKKENYRTFIDEFIIILKSFQKSKYEVVIAGDYNINWLKINDKPIFCEYLDTVLAQPIFCEYLDTVLAQG